MSRLKVCLLCSMVPKESAKELPFKESPVTESLDAHSRQWFSDGYRTSVPGTNLCRQDSDCDPGEICQSGYCAGIHRNYATYGIFRGNEYKDTVEKPGYYTHTHGHNYLFTPELGTMTTLVTSPYASDPQKVRKYHKDIGYTYSYDYA